MWELDHKEGWALKNWCFWTVVLEKTLESPLDSKEIKPVNPKGNQSWIFTGRTDVRLKVQCFGHLMRRADSLKKTLCVCVCKLLSHVQLFVHGILQARILEWIAFPFPRRSSQPRDRTQVSHIAGSFFTSWAIREKTLMMEKIEGKKRGWQRIWSLDGITDSMDMSWNTFWEIVKDRGPWHAAVHGFTKSQTQQLNNNNKVTSEKRIFFFEKLRNKVPKFRICQYALCEMFSSCWIIYTHTNMCLCMYA